MKKYIIFRIAFVITGICFMLNPSFCYGQTLTLATTEWKDFIPTLNAGADYPPSFESRENQSIMTGTIPQALLSLLGRGTFNIKAKLGANNFANNSLKLSVKRNNGDRDLGLCVLCTLTIQGGENYIEIPTGGNMQFFSIRFTALLNVASDIGFKNAGIQNKIEGISVTMPTGTYYATIVYTIEKG